MKVGVPSHKVAKRLIGNDNSCFRGVLKNQESPLVTTWTEVPALIGKMTKIFMHTVRVGALNKCESLLVISRLNEFFYCFFYSSPIHTRRVSKLPSQQYWLFPIHMSEDEYYWYRDKKNHMWKIQEYARFMKNHNISFALQDIA